MQVFKPINNYSSQDVLEWKNTNISSLYVKICKNVATFELMHVKSCDRAESMKKLILDALKTHTINDLEIYINLMDNPINNIYFLQFSSTTNCNVNTIPNFSFYQWKEAGSKDFFSIKDDILSNKTEWENKIDKIMWSGINSNVLRKKMDILKTNEKYEYNLI